MTDRGKAFEKRIESWLKKNKLYYERFFDSRSVGGISAQRPSDYFCYVQNQLYYIECKSSQQKSIPYKYLSQLKRLYNLEKSHKIVCIFLLNFKGEIYAINSIVLYQHILKNPENRASIGVLTAANIGTRLHRYIDLKTYILKYKY